MLRHPARPVALILAAGLLASTLAACSSRPSAHAATASRSAAHWAAVDRTRARTLADSANWAVYGQDYANRRFSPLRQIDTASVARLTVAWVNHSHIPHASESNPVVVQGIMYFSTSLNNVFAIDAATGRQRWHYVHHYHTTTDCCSAINRGVTIYDGRVYMGTDDARLVSLDARTGRRVWDVQVADNNTGYHITGAPLAVAGEVITGVSGGEQGCRCFVAAYDAATGHQLWKFYTIPDPQHGGWWGPWRAADSWGMPFHRDIAREKADSAKHPDAWKHGGGPVWQHPAYDPALGLIFVNVGNPAPDLDGSVRPGDNLYTSSIIALDVKTGKLRWYFQEVSHDRWDYDATTPPVLIDAPDSTGRMVPAVAEAGKDGFVYVVDRRTGKPIRKSAAFVPQINYMTPPTKQGVLIQPGTLGGSDWSPTAYSPQTGYLYVDGSYIPMLYKRHHEPLRPPAQWWGGSTVAVSQGTYGLFNAVDLATGRIAWQQRTGAPLIGGALATAGGVVFTGTSGKHFIAFDARTGKPLWRYAADAAIDAPPITYAVNGRQYVAVAVTGLQTLDSPRGDEMVAFALPATGPTAAAAPVKARVKAPRSGR